jgi:hypothetical protein
LFTAAIVGMQGGELEKDLQVCPIGKHVFVDPDGILLDLKVGTNDTRDPADLYITAQEDPFPA